MNRRLHMKAIRKFYFPNLCITFTLAIIYAAFINITNNNDPTGFHKFILQFAGVLCLIGIANYFFEKLELKNWSTQMVIEFLMNYLIFMVAGYFLEWFGFRIPNIIIITIVFVIIFAYVMLHTNKLLKQDEEWINKLLEKRNAERKSYQEPPV
jgi:fatty acid desaturase